MNTCEICKASKPLSDFSKSYKNRCKACVAELVREKRTRKNLGAMDAAILTAEASASLIVAMGMMVGDLSRIQQGSYPCYTSGDYQYIADEISKKINQHKGKQHER